MSQSWRVAMLVFILSSGASLATLASDGRIPVYQVPTTISAPGSYYLTQDLNGAALTGDVITINASNVTLDLNGHTVTANTGYACVTASNQSNLRITNGALVGGARACYLTSAGTIRIDHLLISGQSGGFGLGAIDVTGLAATSLAFIESNTIQSSVLGPDEGILMNGERGGSISGNTITGMHYGLSLQTCFGLRVESNVITAATATGIYCNQMNNSVIVGNTISQCPGSGTWFANLSNSLVRNNSVSGNTGDGIHTFNGQKNVFEWNTCAGNTGWGINFAGAASSFVYRYNATPGNTSGGITDCCAGINGGGNN